jgi:uncharacterized membrane protein
MTPRTLAPALARPLIGQALLTAGATLGLMLASQMIEAPILGGQLPGTRFAVAIHVTAAIAAVPLGGYVLWARKGDARHKALGRLWAGMMMVIALSSLWLRSLSGGFSFIHLFSTLTLVSIPLAIFYARQGRIKDHLSTMRGLYIGLVVAGVFSFLPDRLLGSFLFG